MEVQPLPMRTPRIIGVDIHNTILTPTGEFFVHVANVYNEAAGTNYPRRKVLGLWADSLEAVSDAVGIEARYQFCNGVVLCQMNPEQFPNPMEVPATTGALWIREQIQGRSDDLYELTRQARHLLRRLSALRALGCRIVVASNQSRLAMQCTLTRWPILESLFDRFYIHDEPEEAAGLIVGLGVAKPNRDFVARLLVAEGDETPARYLHVGNSWNNDALMVKRAGAYGIVFDAYHRYVTRDGRWKQRARSQEFLERFGEPLRSRRIVVVNRHVEIARLIEATVRARMSAGDSLPGV